MQYLIDRMSDEINFMDLASLLSIGPDTTLERLGSAINASIFDASNMAGTLKQKGLIDFTASYPGPNTVTITDVGKALIAEAEGKAASQYDELDDAILTQISGGKRIPVELQDTLNIRPKDLALRIYKLNKQGFVTYNLKSGGVFILLTDAGFLKAKASSATKPQTPQPVHAPTAQPQASPTAAPIQKPPAQQMPHVHKRSKMLYLMVLVLILVIIGGIYYLYTLNYLSKI